jgi:hypothetical protein
VVGGEAQEWIDDIEPRLRTFRLVATSFFDIENRDLSLVEVAHPATKDLCLGASVLIPSEVVVQADEPEACTLGLWPPPADEVVLVIMAISHTEDDSWCLFLDPWDCQHQAAIHLCPVAASGFSLFHDCPAPSSCVLYIKKAGWMMII